MTAVQRLVRRFPLLTYFAIVYSVSAGALVVLGLPRLDAGAVAWHLIRKDEPKIQPAG